MYTIEQSAAKDGREPNVSDAGRSAASHFDRSGRSGEGEGEDGAAREERLVGRGRARVARRHEPVLRALESRTLRFQRRVPFCAPGLARGTTRCSEFFRASFIYTKYYTLYCTRTSE